MTEQSWPNWYPEQFERAAQGCSLQLPVDMPDDLRFDLEAACSLSRLDFSAESQLRKSLRDRLADRRSRDSAHTTTVLLRLGVLALVLLSILTITNSPVRAAFGRIFGYGYLNQTGFIRLDQTLLLPGPLQVEGANRFNISLVVAGQDSTRVWITGGPIHPVGLELEDGSRLALLSSETLTAGSMVWSFGPLSVGQNHPSLILQDGRRVPLGLIPAEEVGLAPTGVNLPSRTPSRMPISPCQADKAGTKLCIQAAQVDAQGMHLLIEVMPAPGQPVPDLRDWGLTLTAAGLAPTSLKAVQSAEEPSSVSLLFAPFPIQEGSVILRANRLSNAGPFELAFTLPEFKPSVSPTPRVIQTPSDRAAPVPTPGLP